MYTPSIFVKPGVRNTQTRRLENLSLLCDHYLSFAHHKKRSNGGKSSKGGSSFLKSTACYNVVAAMLDFLVSLPNQFYPSQPGPLCVWQSYWQLVSLACLLKPKLWEVHKSQLALGSSQNVCLPHAQPADKGAKDVLDVTPCSKLEAMGSKKPLPSSAGVLEGRGKDGSSFLHRVSKNTAGSLDALST